MLKPAAPKKSAKTTGPKRKSRTQAQRTLQTRMQILQAASMVFGQLGYNNTRVEDILEAAGISRPTFYRFFGGKDQAFDALWEAANLSLLQMVSAAVAKEIEPAKKMEKGVEAFLRWLAATGPVAKVLQQEALHPESRLAPRRDSTLRVMRQLFQEETAKLAPDAGFDDLTFSTLVAAIEHVGLSLASQTGRVGEKEILHGKRVAMQVLCGTLRVHI
jgi:TetR/AcrR family transcriptional regulator